ncbi:protein DEHYDRATION-INDUCED 19 homolog 4-like [Lycium ferocissimum]|uniref:protein DEHYDRATION-INDUCED 19 homolog 4-like n=1 Tax=Lycium ferocissimum TaxID=112874 RepID=UPI002814C08A|nr:protein DEHYDRATION-INDUCED 19 homolog 4-like [Lycium ferocissimum]XP_059286173.1 protein DEHYDRATION-INDUCED 19 homolog 4-like [Lycium ferocissimum]XP_059286174.1 protein DEHYDRATION-INDUCED 19 homolog 4-like [Lycium ferocissimum]
MDSDSWIRMSTSSRRHQSRSDFYNIIEEYEGEEESRPEFLCPFCGEDFDIVGLCCHIDEEHAIEAKNGICPFCAKRVGTNLVGHITQQHGNILKVQRKRRLRRGGTNSTLSILRKELREGSLPSILRGSSHLVSSATSDPDPLLSSFINTSASVDEPPEVQPLSSALAACSTEENTAENLSDRNIQPSPLSEKDQEEKARKCEFVQGLLLSTFLEDDDF